MKKYSYRALNGEGRSVRGNLSAANETDLYQQLKVTGLELLDCKAKREGKLSALFASRIKARDMIQLFVHLEQLQRSGVPLLDALGDLRDSSESPKLRDVMSEIYREVSEGKSFSEAMESHPRLFDDVTISITASGEETGNLADSFAQLIVFMKWSDAMKRRVKKALAYPIFTLLVFLAVLAVLMLFTVPQIVGFLKYVDQDLPFATVALIATSDFCQAHWPWLFVVPLVIFGTIKTLNQVSYSFAYRFDAFCLRLPVIGMVIRKVNLSRFCRTFGALFKSGLEILKAMDAANKTASNKCINEALQRSRRQVSDGMSIAGAMNNSGEFPSLVVRMVKIGEESGNLTHVLDQVGEFYDQDVDESVQKMIGMITPTLTIILGFVILWIAAGVFGPIYGILGEVGQ